MARLLVGREPRHRLSCFRRRGFVWWRSSTVVAVVMQPHHARIIAAALVLRSEEPVLSQIEKLITDSQVICQSSKTHAFTRVAHAFLVGGQW